MAFLSQDKRLCVYPVYLDAAASVAGGRKVPRAAAVANPDARIIHAVAVDGLRLRAELELKRHPRDWRRPGRVRVQLHDEDGALLNPEVPSRKELLRKLAELVPRHPAWTPNPPTITIVGLTPPPAGAGSAAAAGAAAKGGKKKGKR